MKTSLIKIGAIYFLAVFFMNGQPAFAQYKVGDVVSDFSLTAVNLQQISLYDFQGKAIFLNFFTTT